MGGIMVRIFIIVIFLSLSVPTLADDAFVCIADLTTGFTFDGTPKKWRSTNFRATSKYFVSKSKTSGEWEVKSVGDPVPLSSCTSVRNDEELVCSEALGWEFRMNRYSLRFLYAYLLGYWDDRTRPPTYVKEGLRQPYLAIGACSPL
jgi:hypothetical protein